MSRWLVRLWMALLLGGSLVASAQEVARTITIGVHASDEVFTSTQPWGGLVRMLEERIPGVSFQIQPLNFAELEVAMLERRIDLLLVNTSAWMYFKHRIGLSEPLLRVVHDWQGQPLPGDAGVILVRAGDPARQQPELLEQRTIVASHPRSVTGYQAQLRRLQRAGVAIDRLDIETLDAPHEWVLGALAAGSHDAAFLRVGVFERWLEANPGRAGEFEPLLPRDLQGYPFAVSTTIYPDRVLSALPHVSPERVQRIVGELLLFEPTLAFRRITDLHGFELPLDPGPVRELRRALQLPPYDVLPRIRLQDLWSQYREALLVAALLLVLLLVSMLYTLFYALRLRALREVNTRNLAELERDRDELTKQREALEYAARQRACLHNIFEATEVSDQPLHRVLQQVAQLAPAGWRFMKQAECRLEWQGRSYCSLHYREGRHQMSAPIAVEDQSPGSITIVYPLLPDDRDYEPFLDSERALLQSIAARVSEMLSRRLHDARARHRQRIYDSIVRHISDSVALIDINTLEFIEFNDAACRMLGYTREEFGRLRLPDLDIQFDEARIRRLAMGGHEQLSRKFETRHVDRHGRIHDVSVVTDRVQLDGQPYAATVWRDITERKRMENELRRLSAVVEQSPESIVITDLDGSIEYVNLAFVENTGYRMEELLGKNPRILQSGRTPRSTYEQMWSCISGGKLWSGELINRRKDGSEYVEWAIIMPIRDPDGAISSYMAIKQDITERKRTEAELEQHRYHLELLVDRRGGELQKSLEQTEAIYNAATSGIMMLRDRHVVKNNRRAEELLGYGPGELVGQLTRAIYADDETYERVGRALYQGLERQGKSSTEAELVRKDGSRFWARISVAPVDPDDQDGGIAGVFEDISDERVAADKLRQAKEQAEAANATKSAFLANISHEIRTPMNAIMGYADLIRQTPPDADSADRAQRIINAARHLMEIINDLLDLSKIEAGRLTLHREQFQVGTLVDQATSMLREQFEAREVELEIDIDAATRRRRLIGDPLRLRQILINYLSNALKFTDRGRIRVGARVEGSQQPSLRLEVEDSGIGIAPEDRDKLFVPFNQLQTSVARKYAGTGLGLAISRRLAEMMDGEVGCESVPGRGSLFWLSAVLESGEALAADIEDAEREAETAPPQPQATAPVGSGPGVLDNDQRTALRCLAEALSRDELGAVGQWQEIAPTLESTLPNRTRTRLDRLIRNFSYAEALQIIESLIEPETA